MDSSKREHRVCELERGQPKEGGGGYCRAERCQTETGLGRGGEMDEQAIRKPLFGAEILGDFHETERTFLCHRHLHLRDWEERDAIRYAPVYACRLLCLYDRGEYAESDKDVVWAMSLLVADFRAFGMLNIWDI